MDFSPTERPTSDGGGSVSGADTVACPHGKLYRRERVLEALLQRRRAGGSRHEAVGSHIRGMKDLHPVRFHVAASGAGGAQKYVAACPITGSDIAAGNVPSFVIVRAAREDPGKEKKNNDVDDDGEDEAARNPNVLSERAIQEMGVAGLQAEYGPFEERDLIRLAPPTTGGVLEEIRRSWEVRMEEEHIAKLKKKKDKKRKGKRGGGDEHPTKARRPSTVGTPTGGRGDRAPPTRTVAAADEARAAVRAAVTHNPVLSSLFGTGQEDRRTARKKGEDLFTRNC